MQSWKKLKKKNCLSEGINIFNTVFKKYTKTFTKTQRNQGKTNLKKNRIEKRKKETQNTN